jgi:hypothetical protein
MSAPQLPPRDVDPNPTAFRIAYRLLCALVFRIWKGGTDNAGSVTLTANAASTTLTDSRIGVTSTVHLTATTSNAAAEVGNGTIYLSETGRVNGSIVITHANNAQTDRTYRYSIHGG